MITRIYLWAQVIFSALLTLWAICMTGRCIVAKNPLFIIICMVALAVVAYTMLYTTSVKELRAYNRSIKKGGK